MRGPRRTLVVAVFTSVLSAVALGQRADTTVVRAGQPIHPGVGTLVEELTLGKGVDAEVYRFTNAFVYASHQGGVYVVDIVDPTNVGDFRSVVRQYDHSGTYVRAFGRNGQGPGEYFAGVGDVKELPDGRVLLSDARGILAYTAAGQPLGRWQALGPTYSLGARLLVDPAGFVFMYGAREGRVRGYGGAVPGNAPPGRQPFLYRFRFDGTLVDTVAPPEAAFPDPLLVGRVHVPLLPYYMSVWNPLGYFVTALSTTYAIDVRKLSQTPVGGGGGAGWHPDDPVVSIRRSVPPVPVQEAERSDWRQSVIMYMRGGSPADANWQWNGPELPREKPPIRNLMSDDAGRIWVQVSQAARVDTSVTIPTRPPRQGERRVDAYYRWVEPAVFDVFEPSGAYVGRVRFPDSIRQVRYGDAVYAIEGDTIWAVEKSADDVPVVKRYHIRWGS